MRADEMKLQPFQDRVSSDLQNELWGVFRQITQPCALASGHDDSAS